MAVFLALRKVVLNEDSDKKVVVATNLLVLKETIAVVTSKAVLGD